MKNGKRVIGLVSAAAISVSLVACSGSSSTTTVTGEAGETYTGTVAEISEDSITVTTEDEENVLITLSSDTVFTYSMAGMEGEGQGPSGEDADEEMPEGETFEEGEMPEGETFEEGEMPEGETFEEGEMPEGETFEEGEMPEGEPPEITDEDSTNGEDQADTTETDDADSEQEESDSSDADNDSSDSENDDSDSSEDSTDETGSEEGQAPNEEGGPGGEAGDFSGDGEGGFEGEEGAGGEGGAGPGGDMGGGIEFNLTYEDVSEGDSVTVVVGDEGTAETVSIELNEEDMEEMMETMDETWEGAGMEDGESGAPQESGSGDENGEMESSSSAIENYEAVTEYTQDTEVSDETLASTGTDENAVLVQTEDITVTLNGVTIQRESDDSTGGDNSSFYGVGASALATNGTLIISDSEITSDAAGGAGVFAYGDGIAYVSDTTISTEQDTAGGIHVAGGGTLYAWDLTVETQGDSSAAIRSDRGSGTMVVDGGEYTSNGTGSPAVYSTADITVNGATLTSNGSEAACIEGLNTIRLFDCDLTGNMYDSDENDCTWNVILYQSMSGDSEVGNSTFEMVGGSLTAGNGGMFYTTNTESTFIISDVDITYADESDFLLKVTGNSNERGWGTSGENGADCNFTAQNQELEGDIIWDSISQLDFYLIEDSVFTGAVINDESQAGDGGDGTANVYIDESSTWIVTGDSTLGQLSCEGTIEDEEGNTVTIVGSDGTEYVSGTSSYTITVESYATEADFSGASSVESFSDYEVEQIE